MDIIKSYRGTIQNKREFPAFAEDYINIDESKLEDLLIYMTGLSKLFKYYNNENKVEGDWSSFMIDEALILSSILQSNPASFEKRFNKNISKSSKFKREEKQKQYFIKCCEDIVELVKKFDSWAEGLRVIETFVGIDLTIRKEIRNAVLTKLKEAFLTFYSTIKDIGYFEIPKNDLENLSNIWGLEGYTIEKSKEENKTQKFKNAVRNLEEVFQAFYETLIYLKQKAPEYLNNSLKRDYHYPETSLLISFLKLYRESQGELNKIKSRYLDFYYKESLEQRFRTKKMDRVYLKFTPYPTVPFAEIKQGSRFLAGIDAEGRDIVYTADNYLQVTQAKIEHIQNVFLSSRRLSVKGKEFDLVDAVSTTTIPLGVQKIEVSDTLIPVKTFPTFGEEQVASIGENNVDNGSIGIGISSPVLFLNTGERNIELKFVLTEEGYNHFRTKLEDLAFYNKSSYDELFIKAFIDAFTIRITGLEGWLDIKNYVVTRNDDKFLLIIKFGIENDQPQIVNFNKKVHAGNYSESQPIIEVLLNNDSFIYSYSLLQPTHLDQVSVDVDVVGFKDIQIYNNIGQLNPDNPFYPFGPIPHIGSYLLIGSNEVFQKSINSLKLNMEWFDLPRHKSGLFGYYKEYELRISNGSFECSLSALNNGRWVPENKNIQKFKLFRTEDDPHGVAPHPDKKLSHHTILDNIDVTHLKAPANNEQINKPLVYKNMLNRGFVKLELTSPDFGFAHQIYPTVLSDITLKNSRSGLLPKKESKIKKLPNVPYSPQLKSLTLDYSARAVISLNERSENEDDSGKRGKVYHINPYGQKLVYPDNSKQVTNFLPVHNYQGSLVLGLSKINPPETLTVLVEMIDEYTTSSEEEPPVIEWYYLCDDEWKYLKPSRVIRDDTNNFLKTGIIEIVLPHDIKKGNTILNGELYWLKAAAVKNAHVASKLIGVTTQVLTASLMESNSDLENHLKTPLEGRTITRALDNITGIENIEQPLDSFGGLPTEVDKNFRVRIGEQLRHKNRIITAWDVERTVLDEFPSIYKVACLPNMSSKKLDASGSILVVVTPKIDNMSNKTEPMASSELLYRIKDFISQRVSPFVHVEVRNPSYERLKVICSAKFKDGFSYGYYLQKLNEEIGKYISGYDEGGQTDPELGGKINTSDILTYLRTLPYVDFITKFSMVQAARDFSGKYILLDTSRDGKLKPDLQATKPWAVLVSAKEHQITVLDEKMEERAHQAGIDWLELGHDFIIEE